MWSNLAELEMRRQQHHWKTKRYGNRLQDVVRHYSEEYLRSKQHKHDRNR